MQENNEQSEWVRTDRTESEGGGAFPAEGAPTLPPEENTSRVVRGMVRIGEAMEAGFIRIVPHFPRRPRGM